MYRAARELFGMHWVVDGGGHSKRLVNQFQQWRLKVVEPGNCWQLGVTEHDGGCSLLVEKLKQCDVVAVVAVGG